MKFCTYLTHHEWAKRQGTDLNLEQFTDLNIRTVIKMAKDMGMDDPFTPLLLKTEQEWVEDRRPYYNIYPSIIPTLTKLKLDIDSSHVRLPLTNLMLRFPEESDHPLKFQWGNKEYRIRTALCNSGFVKDSIPVDGKSGLFQTNEDSFAESNKAVHSQVPDRSQITSDTKDIPCICFWIDIHEAMEGELFGLHRMLYKHIVVQEGRTIEWSLLNCPPHPSSDVGVQFPDWFITDLTRLVCTICLLADNPEIVQPDVLNCDATKFEATQDPKYITKAHNRGKVGWTVGKDIDLTKSPHYRNSCLAALYWTGKGKLIPRIRFRAGCLVNRKLVNTIPTGYLGVEPEGDVNES